MRLERVYTFKGFHKASVSPDNKLLALVDGSRVDLFDAASHKKMSGFEKSNTIFLTAQFSPDGRLLAVSYKENQVLVKVAIYDVATAKQRVTLPVSDDDWRRNVDLSFSPDGNLLASNVEGIARLWDAQSGKEMRKFLPEGQELEAERALLSPDGRFMAAYFRFKNDPARNEVRLWNVDTGQEKSFPTEVYLDWRFSADSKLLGLTAIVDKGKPNERSVAEIWDVSTAIRLKTIEVPNEWRSAYTLAFSPDSKLLSVGGYGKFGIFAIDTGQLLTTEAHHGKGLFQDSELPSQLSDIGFSPDGRWLLTGGNDRTVKLWRINQ